MDGAVASRLKSAARLGFRFVDIRPGLLESIDRFQLNDTFGLQVSCIGLAAGLPCKRTLGSKNLLDRQKLLGLAREGLDHLVSYNGKDAYIVPLYDSDPETMAHYMDSLVRLADMGREREIRIHVEHYPGRALPSAASVLDLIDHIRHPNLYLLVDFGHLLISGEDPAMIIKRAGERLGYVHVNDNDGKTDSHLGLLEGSMTRASLENGLTALDQAGYQGNIAIELGPGLPDTDGSLQHSKQVIEGMLTPGKPEAIEDTKS